MVAHTVKVVGEMGLKTLLDHVPMASRAGAAGRLSARTIREAEQVLLLRYGLLGLSGGRRDAAGTSTIFLQRVVLCLPRAPLKGTV